MSDTNWNQNTVYYDANGNPFFVDQNGYSFYYDQDGNPYYVDSNGSLTYFDQNGNPYYIDELGNPHYYNQQQYYTNGGTVVRNEIVVKVPKKNSGVKTLIKTLVIVFVLLVGAGFANKYFIKGPKETMKGFVVAFDAMDLKEMVSYLEEKDRKVYEAEFGLIGIVGDAVSGFPISGILDVALDIAPSVGKNSLPKLEIVNFESITYYHDRSGCDPASSSFDFFELNKLICDRADLIVTLKDGNKVETEKVIFVREGFGKWKISSESSGGGDFLGIGNLLDGY